MEYKL
jgi:hypothetical protein